MSDFPIECGMKMVYHSGAVVGIMEIFQDNQGPDSI